MKQDILFEVIPHAKTVSKSYAEKFVDRLVDALGEIRNVGALNIPEIVEENHIGLPYYKNADNREFGVILRDKCRKNIIINTVVVHHTSKSEFEQWLNESVNGYKIKNFVFVGGKINSINYKGPNILEANSIAKSKKINFGNIFIPEREGEADRLISKTVSGCSFFTSQVLFESEKIINVINEYLIKCTKANLEPAKFFLSFSPVSNLEDIAFIKWLGAEINEKTEHRLSSSQNIGEESTKVIKEVLDKILNFFDKINVKVPLGLNIEYISLHNLELSKNLCEKFKYIVN